jgi:hypothetical protein
MVIRSDLEQEEAFLAPDYYSSDEGDEDRGASSKSFGIPAITIAWLEERIAELEEANNAICSSRTEEDERPGVS